MMFHARLGRLITHALAVAFEEAAPVISCRQSRAPTCMCVSICLRVHTDSVARARWQFVVSCFSHSLTCGMREWRRGLFARVCRFMVTLNTEVVSEEVVVVLPVTVVGTERKEQH